tara:strand:+ start:126 stop:416 length:291 start_codon:yes stop_codon:yes gene_type:complete
MFNKSEKEKIPTPISPLVPSPKPAPPKPNKKPEMVFPTLSLLRGKIKDWNGGRTVIENVSVGQYNHLNVEFKNDKEQREYRFDYDQDGKVLTISKA